MQPQASAVGSSKASAPSSSNSQTPPTNISNIIPTSSTQLVQENDNGKVLNNNDDKLMTASNSKQGQQIQSLEPKIYYLSVTLKSNNVYTTQDLLNAVKNSKNLSSTLPTAFQILSLMQTYSQTGDAASSTQIDTLFQQIKNGVQVQQPLDSANDLKSQYLVQDSEIFPMQKLSGTLGMQLFRNGSLINGSLVQVEKNAKVASNPQEQAALLAKQKSLRISEIQSVLVQSKAQAQLAPQELQWPTDAQYAQKTFRVLFCCSDPKKNKALYCNDAIQAQRIADTSISSLIFRGQSSVDANLILHYLPNLFQSKLAVQVLQKDSGLQYNSSNQSQINTIFNPNIQAGPSSNSQLDSSLANSLQQPQSANNTVQQLPNTAITANNNNNNNNAPTTTSSQQIGMQQNAQQPSDQKQQQLKPTITITESVQDDHDLIQHDGDINTTENQTTTNLQDDLGPPPQLAVIPSSASNSFINRPQQDNSVAPQTTAPQTTVPSTMALNNNNSVSQVTNNSVSNQQNFAAGATNINSTTTQVQSNSQQPQPSTQLTSSNTQQISSSVSNQNLAPSARAQQQSSNSNNIPPTAQQLAPPQVVPQSSSGGPTGIDASIKTPTRPSGLPQITFPSEGNTNNNISATPQQQIQPATTGFSQSVAQQSLAVESLLQPQGQTSPMRDPQPSSDIQSGSVVPPANSAADTPASHVWLDSKIPEKALRNAQSRSSIDFLRRQALEQSLWGTQSFQLQLETLHLWGFLGGTFNSLIQPFLKVSIYSEIESKKEPKKFQTISKSTSCHIVQQNIKKSVYAFTDLENIDIDNIQKEQAKNIKFTFVLEDQISGRIMAQSLSDFPSQALRRSRSSPWQVPFIQFVQTDQDFTEPELRCCILFSLSNKKAYDRQEVMREQIKNKKYAIGAHYNQLINFGAFSPEQILRKKSIRRLLVPLQKETELIRQALAEEALYLQDSLNNIIFQHSLQQFESEREHMVSLEAYRSDWETFMADIKYRSAHLSLFQSAQDTLTASMEYIEADTLEIEQVPVQRSQTNPSAVITQISDECIFYKADVWEDKHPDFYSRLESLVLKGIPNQLRLERIWLELLKQGRYLVQVGDYLKITTLPSNANKRLLYARLRELQQRHLQENIYQQQVADDIDTIMSENTLSQANFSHFSEQQCLILLNAMQTYAFYVIEQQNTPLRLFYSSHVLRIACKAMQIIQCVGSSNVECDTFWLTLCLISQCLPRYFNIAQQKNVKLQYSDTYTVFGLREDTWTLRYLVQDELKTLYTHFENIGFRYENFFSEHFLTLYSDFFNEEVVFRLWDLLILRSNCKTNSVHHTLIATAVIFLETFKDQFLKMKNLDDLLLVIRISAKTLWNINDFVKQIDAFVQRIFIDEPSNIFETIKKFSRSFFTTGLQDYLQTESAKVKKQGTREGYNSVWARQQEVKDKLQRQSKRITLAMLDGLLANFSRITREEESTYPLLRASSKTNSARKRDASQALLGPKTFIFLFIHKFSIDATSNSYEVRITCEEQKRHILIKDVSNCSIFESFLVNQSNSVKEILVQIFEILSDFAIELYRFTIHPHKYVLNQIHKDFAELESHQNELEVRKDQNYCQCDFSILVSQHTERSSQLAFYEKVLALDEINNICLSDDKLKELYDSLQRQKAQQNAYILNTQMDLFTNSQQFWKLNSCADESELMKLIKRDKYGAELLDGFSKLFRAFSLREQNVYFCSYLEILAVLALHLQASFVSKTAFLQRLLVVAERRLRLTPKDDNQYVSYRALKSLEIFLQQCFGFQDAVIVDNVVGGKQSQTPQIIKASIRLQSTVRQNITECVADIAQIQSRLLFGSRSGALLINDELLSSLKRNVQQSHFGQSFQGNLKFLVKNSLGMKRFIEEESLPGGKQLYERQTASARHNFYDSDMGQIDQHIIAVMRLNEHYYPLSGYDFCDEAETVHRLKTIPLVSYFVNYDMRVNQVDLSNKSLIRRASRQNNLNSQLGTANGQAITALNSIGAQTVRQSSTVVPAQLTNPVAANTQPSASPVTQQKQQQIAQNTTTQNQTANAAPDKQQQAPVVQPPAQQTNQSRAPPNQSQTNKPPVNPVAITPPAPLQNAAQQQTSSQTQQQQLNQQANQVQAPPVQPTNQSQSQAPPNQINGQINKPPINSTAVTLPPAPLQNAAQLQTSSQTQQQQQANQIQAPPQQKITSKDSGQSELLSTVTNRSHEALKYLQVQFRRNGEPKIQIDVLQSTDSGIQESQNIVEEWRQMQALTPLIGVSSDFDFRNVQQVEVSQIHNRLSVKNLIRILSLQLADKVLAEVQNSLISGQVSPYTEIFKILSVLILKQQTNTNSESTIRNSSTAAKIQQAEEEIEYSFATYESHGHTLVIENANLSVEASAALLRINLQSKPQDVVLVVDYKSAEDQSQQQLKQSNFKETLALYRLNASVSQWLPCKILGELQDNFYNERQFVVDFDFSIKDYTMRHKQIKLYSRSLDQILLSSTDRFPPFDTQNILREYYGRDQYFSIEYNTNTDRIGVSNQGTATKSLAPKQFFESQYAFALPDDSYEIEDERTSARQITMFNTQVKLFAL